MEKIVIEAIKKIGHKIGENKEYLLGLFFVLLTIGLFILLFFNKSLCIQEGWYTIYVKQFLSGLIPYRDFKMIVPPSSLFICTLFYKLFGGYFIVFHYAGLVERLILFGTMYHLFTRFFSKQNAAYATIVGGIFLTCIVCDNSLFTYNELAILIGMIAINLLLTFTEKLDKNNVIDYKILFLLGLVQSFTFLNKQTFGIITSFAILAILLIIITKKLGVKKYFKPLLTFLGGFSILIGSIILYFAANGALFAFIDNTLLTGASAKGDLKTILLYFFKSLGSDEYMWVIFIAAFIFILVFFASKNKKVQEKGYNLSNFFIISSLISILTIGLAYFFVKLSPDNTVDTSFFLQIHLFFTQMGAVSVVFTTLAAFYFFCKIVFEKEVDLLIYRKFILFGMIFSFCYSVSLSTVWPDVYFYSIALFFAFCLDYKTPFYNLKNNLIYLSIFVMLFLGVSLKLISPFYWHSWVSGNVTRQLKKTNIEVLKGLYLPVDEINTIEEIKNTVDKYSKKDDKIFIYNNIQGFYEILERKPYTNNVSHYWDVCPDQYAEEDAKIILQSPPPIILYFQAPPGLVTVHEKLFRQGSFAKQREIDKAILSMMKNDEYVTVKSYKPFKPKYEKYISDEKVLEQYTKIKNRMFELKRISNVKDVENEFDMNVFYEYAELEKAKAEMDYEISRKYKLNSKRSFLPEGTEIDLLIKKELYANNNHR